MRTDPRWANHAAELRRIGRGADLVNSDPAAKLAADTQPMTSSYAGMDASRLETYASIVAAELAIDLIENQPHRRRPAQQTQQRQRYIVGPGGCLIPAQYA